MTLCSTKLECLFLPCFVQAILIFKWHKTVHLYKCISVAWCIRNLKRSSLFSLCVSESVLAEHYRMPQISGNSTQNIRLA
jgi:hypothetical protein